MPNGGNEAVQVLRKNSISVRKKLEFSREQPPKLAKSSKKSIELLYAEY